MTGQIGQGASMNGAGATLHLVPRGIRYAFLHPLLK